ERVGTLHRVLVQDLRGQQLAVDALEPANGLPRLVRPLEQVAVAVAIEIDQLPVEPAAILARSEPTGAAAGHEVERLDALLEANQQLWLLSLALAEQHQVAAGRVAGEQIPMRAALPTAVAIALVDDQLLTARGEHQQFELTVAV